MSNAAEIVQDKSLIAAIEKIPARFLALGDDASVLGSIFPFWSKVLKISDMHTVTR